MQFTKATYKRALLLAQSEVYSRADILERAKNEYNDYVQMPYFVTYEEYRSERALVDQARAAYNKAEQTYDRLLSRARREGIL